MPDVNTQFGQKFVDAITSFNALTLREKNMFLHYAKFKILHEELIVTERNEKYEQ